MSSNRFFGEGTKKEAAKEADNILKTAMKDYLSKNRGRLEEEGRAMGLDDEAITALIEKTTRATELELMQKFKENLKQEVVAAGRRSPTKPAGS